VATQTLSIKNMTVVPFRGAVQKYIERVFEPLVASGHLVLDFDESTGSPRYEVRFVEKYKWSASDRPGCRRWPSILGDTEVVYVEAIRDYRFCTDVTNCKTCEPMFKRSPDELGKMLAYVAIHEAAHLLGLMEGDRAGHSDDERNVMFVASLHKEWAPLEKDSQRTMKYRVVEGDSLSRIAHRIGFWPPRFSWRTLYDLKGRDGKANRTLLRSGRPDMIFPGEEIWVPDVNARTTWQRALELTDKAFTSSQLATMRKWIDEGRTAIQFGPQ